MGFVRGERSCGTDYDARVTLPGEDPAPVVGLVAVSSYARSALDWAWQVVRETSNDAVGSSAAGTAHERQR